MRKVLVANRGEIACRVIRSCHERGLQAVAVYSDADRTAMHVAMADEAVAIGPAPARQSYLDADAILAAAKSAQADAVHPGYGFLSENSDFARAVQAHGLAWIGPDPDTIDAMGDKEQARKLAADAGVPVLPGSRRFAAGDLDGLADAAAAVGYPLLVKAAGGGGGIGMVKVEDPARLAGVVASTQALAERAFGDGTVYLERYVPSARHVEVQVFGFGDGRVVHFYERDCSLQRRFQKVVEESPAPGLGLLVLQRMYAAATMLASAVRYKGAGTIEFVVDARDHTFYFLEMNTRIQVEHPVTEMTTGVDLVALQLRLAAGEDLSGVTQDSISRRGHAVECRLYAEAPEKGFLPSPGTLQTLVFPAPSDSVRVDTGVREGDAVTPFYDPMIAKIIACGATRDDAIAAARDALRAVRVEGLRTNRDFLLAVLAHWAFVAGDVDTTFIDRHKGELLPPKAS
ncbi:MAG: acetyl-CoA carboxylase biotin carboxylase subunit [Proteobacteria bacterium]|nr:acetyl-CoA carboxylase biotin carboxylase subunit [Pseudomonadota bacterium]